MASLPALGAVFAVIGLIELVDRTNFALIGLAARKSGLATWTGAAVAFLVTSAIAVGIGTVLLRLLAADLHYVQIAGGIFILGYAAFLASHPSESRSPPAARSAFATAFLMILLLELGDTTMILLVLFTGSAGDPIGVFLAGSAALLLVAGSACFIGARLGERVEPKSLERAVIVILVIVGILTILIAVDPGLFPAFL